MVSAPEEWDPQPPSHSPVQVNNKNKKCVIIKEELLQKQQKYMSNQDLLMSAISTPKQLLAERKLGDSRLRARKGISEQLWGHKHNINNTVEAEATFRARKRKFEL